MQRSQVERAADGDAEVLVAPPPLVLHRRVQARPLEDQMPACLHVGHRWRATKRTRPPGANRAGGVAPSSKSGRSVCPMRCQPPGLAQG